MIDPGVVADRGLASVLEALVEGAAAELHDLLVGAYLVGSLAIGGFDDQSDVDFVIATTRAVPDEHVPGLQALHARVHTLPSRFASRLDGSYVPVEVLRRHDPRHTRLLYLDNGSSQLVRSAHCNREVIRWMLRERGITLCGPAPDTLVDPVPPERLREDVVRDMRLWAEELAANPAMLDDRREQAYTVLSYCRMLHTVECGGIVPKSTAATWARSALPAHWSRLVDRALATRSDPACSPGCAAEPGEVQRTRDLVAWAIARVGAVAS